MSDMDDEDTRLQGVWPRPRPSTTSMDESVLEAIVYDENETEAKREGAQFELNRRLAQKGHGKGKGKGKDKGHGAEQDEMQIDHMDLDDISPAEADIMEMEPNEQKGGSSKKAKNEKEAIRNESLT